MTNSSCQSPLEWDTLLAYWLGELDPDSEMHTEEHYLGCAQCSHRLEQLAALAHGVHTVARKSGVNMIINDRFVRRLTEDGLQVREYHVPINGSVNCTVAPEDDFVVAYLETPVEAAKRIDMVYLDSEGNSEMRQEDIPFTTNSGGVVFSHSIGALRALPATTLRLRLLSVDSSGDRVLGEYTFNHTPYASQSRK